MIMVIDNYDSFVYNLVQYLGESGEAVSVIRNDRISAHDIIGRSVSAIVVSPGPGTPDSAGNICDIIRACAGRVPILGVCLGHQAIAYAFGAAIIQAPHIVHGKAAWIQHDGKGIYQGMKCPFSATRYHSLVVDPDTLPSCLHITSWTRDGTVMGVRHREYRIEGVQFHPESILTTCGKHLVRNFLKGVASEDRAVS
jgi:anthranilate synthase/aminodeoxychorismate synthase-like glutamine amidotransferase